MFGLCLLCLLYLFLFTPPDFSSFLTSRDTYWVLYFFVILQSGVLQSWVCEFSEVRELPGFPGSLFLSMAFLFLLKLICFTVVNIAVNGARYIPYLLYSSKQMLVRA